MISSYLLVDFDNVAEFEPFRLNRVRLEASVDRVVRAAEKMVELSNLSNQCFERLDIRLYGGWHDGETGAHSEIRQMLARIDLPRRIARKRAIWTIADCLIAHAGVQLLNTTIRRAGLGRLRVENSHPQCPQSLLGCAHLNELRSWNKQRCPNQQCGIHDSDIASRREQKAVDTHIVSDAVYFAACASLGNERIWLSIFSDDYDMIPALVSAKALSNQSIFMQIRSASTRKKHYDPTLEELAIQVCQIS